MKIIARALMGAALLVSISSAADAKGGIYFAGPLQCGYTYAKARATCEGAMAVDRWKGTSHMMHILKSDPATGLNWTTTAIEPYQIDVVIKKGERGYNWRRVQSFFHL